MRIERIMVATALVFFAIGALCGFFLGKGMYDRPIEESVLRDTITVTDTITRYYPKPVGIEKVRTEYKWLTRVTTDTVTRSSVQHDSVLVEVPITSKHYNAPEYDAWVSGYEPSLDSIKVYRETQVITERITISKPPNKFELDVIGGVEYNINNKRYIPYAGGELLYKPNRLQVGIRGGVLYTDKVEPVIGAVAKIRLY